MTDVPYRRIASELRARIDGGRLAPGARLPSTRALARRHKVALATAARALRLLADEGVVRSVPRVGTVVVAPRTKSPHLHRDAIVAAAIELADEQGLDALSMRAVAARVGAPPMSIYRHVRSRDELARAMAEAVFAAHPLPETASGSWRDRIELAARSEWQTMRRHPWLARVVSLTRPHASPYALRFADWVLDALDRPGFDAATKLRLHVILHAFAQGLALNLEEEARAESETGVSEEEFMKIEEREFATLAATGRYPAFARMLAEVQAFDLDFDVLFETSLAVFLDGVEALVARRGR